MADRDRPVSVTGTVKLESGEEVQFSLNPNLGWQQWGNRTEVLGCTSDLMDALASAAGDFLVDPDEEEDA